MTIFSHSNLEIYQKHGKYKFRPNPNPTKHNNQYQIIHKNLSLPQEIRRQHLCFIDGAVTWSCQAYSPAGTLSTSACTERPGIALTLHYASMANPRTNQKMVGTYWSDIYHWDLRPLQQLQGCMVASRKVQINCYICSTHMESNKFDAHCIYPVQQNC